MNYPRFLFLTAASVLASQVSAGTMGPTTPSWAWVGTISAGPVWTKSGETQTFYLSPDIEKTYVATKSNRIEAFGELFLGMQKVLSGSWMGQLGLAAATMSNSQLEGIIWDDADPQFDNFSYLYKVRNNRITVKGKLLFDNGYRFIPWVSGGLGVGFNRAHGFTNTPLIFEALPTPNFTNNTTTTFAYTLGLGIQKPINQHWQLGLSYEFADWGKNSLTRASGQTVNSGLALDHFYTNGLLFNLTYVA